MFMMSFDDALTRANFSFFFIFYKFIFYFFDIFQWGAFEPPQTLPLATPLLGLVDTTTETSTLRR